MIKTGTEKTYLFLIPVKAAGASAPGGLYYNKIGFG